MSKHTFIVYFAASLILLALQLRLEVLLYLPTHSSGRWKARRAWLLEDSCDKSEITEPPPLLLAPLKYFARTGLTGDWSQWTRFAAAGELLSVTESDSVNDTRLASSSGKQGLVSLTGELHRLEDAELGVQAAPKAAFVR